jgi:TetR/AcrR family transcriptional regulator, tetracycline repressor protein
MLDVIQHQALARYLPRMANKAFIVRWSNGTEVPLDTSFDLFIDVIILGLEQSLKARR